MTLATPALPSHCQLSWATTPPLPLATAPCPGPAKREEFSTATKEGPGVEGKGRTARLKEGVASESHSSPGSQVLPRPQLQKKQFMSGRKPQFTALAALESEVSLLCPGVMGTASLGHLGHLASVFDLV